MKLIFSAALAALVFIQAGCSTTGGSQTQRKAMQEQIKAEVPGNYYVGRRYFKEDYKFWGYVRSPGQPWSTAKLVCMNEWQKLSPDRAAGQMGSDNDFEYKLTGHFSGDTVYEPASNGFYPEFVLTGYELRSQKPPYIYKEPGATNPKRRVIPKLW